MAYNNNFCYKHIVKVNRSMSMVYLDHKILYNRGEENENK